MNAMTARDHISVFDPDQLNPREDIREQLVAVAQRRARDGVCFADLLDGLAALSGVLNRLQQLPDRDLATIAHEACVAMALGAGTDARPGHLGHMAVDTPAFLRILTAARWEVAWHSVLEQVEIRRSVESGEPEPWMPISKCGAALLWNDCADVAYLPRSVSALPRPWRFGGVARQDLLFAAARANARDGMDAELSDLALAVYEVARRKAPGTYALSVDEAARAIGGKNRYEGKHRLPMAEAKEVGRGLRMAGFVKVKRQIALDGGRRKVWLKPAPDGEAEPELDPWTPGQKLTSIGG